MKKETRYNTIFIIVLLAVSLPGITMLVRKKLSQPPRESRGALAAPVRTEVVYIDPIPKGPRLQVVVPPLTRQWVAEQSPLVAQLPPDITLSSARRSFEVIGIDRMGGRLGVTLLLWDPRLPQTADKMDLAIIGGTESRKGVIDSLQRLRLPETVLEELRNRGYVSPPWYAWRAEASFPGETVEGELRLKAEGDGGVLEDHLDLATLTRRGLKFIAKAADATDNHP